MQTFMLQSLTFEQGFAGKKLQHDFLKMGEGSQRRFENSSDLLWPPVLNDWMGQKLSDNMSQSSLQYLRVHLKHSNTVQ